MVHCPDCETTLQHSDDVEFVEMDARLGFVRASKRFYVTRCAHCGYAMGSGVAAARATATGDPGD